MNIHLKQFKAHSFTNEWQWQEVQLAVPWIFLIDWTRDFHFQLALHLYFVTKLPTFFSLPLHISLSLSHAGSRHKKKTTTKSGSSSKPKSKANKTHGDSLSLLEFFFCWRAISKVAALTNPQSELHIKFKKKKLRNTK